MFYPIIISVTLFIDDSYFIGAFPVNITFKKILEKIESMFF